MAENWGIYTHADVRIKWLKLGDSNNGFFQASTKVRVANNKITNLVDSNGEILESEQNIHNEILQFYQKLLSSLNQNLKGVDIVL